MKSILLSSLLMLASCGMFTMDVTPAYQAKLTQTQVALDVFDNFTVMVIDSKGITQEQKDAILAKIAQRKADYLALEEPQKAFLSAAGTLDRTKLLDDALDLYMRAKAK